MYGIEVYEETKGEVESMCNLGEALVEKGRIEGLKEGRQKGRQEGRKKGREEGRKKGREEARKEGEKRILIDSLRKIMKNLNLSYEESASLLELTEKEIEKYRELIIQ